MEKTKRSTNLDHSDQKTKNYHRLLLNYEEQVHTITPDFNIVERVSKTVKKRVLGNASWDKYELHLFFKALARFGKKRPMEIAKWIGSKTSIEVIGLID